MSDTVKADKKQNGKSSGRMMKLLFFLVVISLAGLGWLFVSSSNKDEIAVIRSPEQPVRVKPVNEGGRDIPHQDSRVLGMIGDLNNKDEQVETLVLGNKAPEMPPTPVAEDAEDDSQQTIVIDAPSNTLTAQTSDVSEKQSDAAEMAAKTENDTQSDIEQQADSSQADNRTDKSGDDPVDFMPKQRPVQTTQKIDENTEIQLFTAQVAAFRSQETAEKTAALLNEKHKARLNNISLGIVRADNANGVTYWRVTSEPVRKEDANDLCTKLNKAGQDCIVKKAGG